MELKLTQEQIERLRPVERHLERAVKNADLLGVTATECRTILWPVFKEVYKAEPGNVYCNACIFTACKKLGALYFRDKEGTKQAATATQAPETGELPAKEKKTPQKAKNTPKKGKGAK